MTAQFPEIIIYKGKSKRMAGEPLNVYLKSLCDPPVFWSNSSACWRGYCGTWLFKDFKLYLVKLSATITDHKEVDMNYLFPGQNKVFADWFSDTVRLTDGKCLYHVHGGYSSIYEKGIFLTFKNGLLIEETYVDNRQALYNKIDKYKKEALISITKKYYYGKGKWNEKESS